MVEGVPTTRAVMNLAREKGVEMPITAAIYSILYEGVPAASALGVLMAREVARES